MPTDISAILDVMLWVCKVQAVGVHAVFVASLQGNDAPHQPKADTHSIKDPVTTVNYKV
jgi:hypothetical protein